MKDWTLIARDPRHGGGVVTNTDLLARALATFGSVGRVTVGRRPGARRVGSGWSRVLIDPIRLASESTVPASRCVVVNSAIGWRPLVRDCVYVNVLKRRTESRLVLFLHGWDERVWKDVMRPGLWRRVFRSTVDRADVVLVLAEAFRRDLIELGVEPAKVRTVTTCFDAELLGGLGEVGSQEGPPTFLFLGRLSAAKGVFTLLEATGRLARAGRAFHLLLAGHGPAARAIDRSIAAHGLADRVQRVGYIRDRAKREALARAGVLVLPSRREAMPLAVLEGMAAGCAVIATPVGALPEVFRGRDSGIIHVPPDDPAALAAAMQWCIDRPDQLRALQRRAHAEAWSGFTPAVAARRFLDALDGPGTGFSHARSSRDGTRAAAHVRE